MYQLSEADARAIDLFLETKNAAGDGGVAADGGGGSSQAEALVTKEQLAAAAKVFDLIGVMPLFEPAADLAARTLQAVGRMERRRRRAAHAGELGIAQQMPPQL